MNRIFLNIIIQKITILIPLFSKLKFQIETFFQRVKLMNVLQYFTKALITKGSNNAKIDYCFIHSIPTNIH